ncbi:phenylacetate--CoA ligase family protein [Mangrovimonas aestuarii]|uniref:phenylacetate--CoA ligase family protein n=1 Tax=Mangrovimonas aestuarii TaxID=3018443 RepID=UPI0023787739|nr:phenylacetate--CoA ligase family protein [Mangrovimonas aestuarii]
MNIFDLTLRLNGYPLDDAKVFLQKLKAKRDEDFLGFIQQQKREIIKFHLNQNPIYKSFGRDIDLNNWNSVPVMTKRDLQQPLTNRLSNGYSKKNIYINKTSGSSGDPFVFAKDKFCHALTWAIIMDRFSWYNIDFNTSKQARFYGIPLDRAGYHKERLKDYMGNRYRFSVFDLSDQAFDKVLSKFKASKFDYINGYTSPIVQFSKYLKRNNLVLKDICPTLKSCIVTSEMLFEDDKLTMEKQFGIPVINEYGASELDLIAFQTPNGIWQLNNETLFVEVLDENNKPLPNGEEGRIVITSLFNKAHPFIRYDIGDLGIISKDSTPRVSILKKLTGRTNDIAILPSGKKAAGLTFYYVTKSIIEDESNVESFVIEQHSKSQFHIKYTSKTSLCETKEQSITDAMERYLEKGLNISFERKSILDRNTSGKLKQFQSFINTDSR